MKSLAQRTDKICYINGQWQPPEQASAWQLHNPATGEVILNTHLASAKDAAKAVQAAAAAFPAWQNTVRAERANYLEKLAQQLENNREQLAQYSTLNNGKPLQEAELDVADAVSCYRYYAELIRNRPDSIEQPSMVKHLTMLRCEEAIGVCALITPWNFPMVTTAWKLAPALAAGCTVILKPSEYTLLPEMMLGDYLSAIKLPAGVVNIIAGGEAVGSALTTHPLVDKVSFTGSNNIGETVMRQAATGVKNLSLELGGKSAILLTDDIDLEAAISWIIGGFCFNAGQICSATSRLIVPEKLHANLIPALTEAVAQLNIGDGFNRDNHIGAITTAAQFARIQQYFDIAKTEQLHCLIGGTVAATNGQEKGQFIRPTIYDRVPPDSRLWNEEIFGPVLLVRTYENEQEAIDMANQGSYGLVASIACRDTTRALRLARAIRAGHIWINHEQIVPADSGWGGFKQSGIGRELGEAGLEAYLGSKHILLPKAE